MQKANMHYPISMHEFVDPPKGGSSSFAPRHSLQAASALGLIHLRCFSSSQFGIVCKQPLPSRAASVGVGCQKAVVGVHHKRNPFGIVVKPTTQRGLLLGMCEKFTLRLLLALICRQSGAGTTLGTKNSEGLYKTYCPLLVIWVSGSRCPAITANAR
jgi:hypothetical protein